LYSHLLYKDVKIRISPPFVYGSETWSVTLREEHRLRDFENGVLKRIFAVKRGKVTEEMRNAHYEKLYDLCSSRS
jgi:hypothetical protein